MTSVPQWSVEDLLALPPENTRLVVTPSCRSLVSETLKFEMAEDPAAEDTVVLVGGGVLMDQWKKLRIERGFKLVCVPSVFGSGAEVSSVIVLNAAVGKEIEMDDRFKPDARVYWPALLDSVPEDQAKDACGDVWSHALEAFISPLADETVRCDLAELIQELVETPISKDPIWFELSARACELQSRSSVGVIHGIAHTVEPLLNDARTFGHAALCSISLWPVLNFNRTHSEKWGELVQAHGLNESAIEQRLKELFDADRFAQVKALMPDHWKTILRDRCTRTNGVLVRPAHLAYFTDTVF